LFLLSLTLNSLLLKVYIYIFHLNINGLAEGLGSGVESLVLIQNLCFWDMKHEFLFVQYISSSWIYILPVIFLCIDKSLKWTAYLHFQNFPMPFDIFFFFLCIVKSLEWAVIVWFLDVIAITFLQVSQCSLRDLLLHCCTDDAPDVRQSAFALLGDLARVSLMCICIRHTEALTSIDGISLMLMVLKHGM
jgi:hypothetical protein